MLGDALGNMADAVGNEGHGITFDNDSGADIDKQMAQVGILTFGNIGWYCNGRTQLVL